MDKNHYQKPKLKKERNETGWGLEVRKSFNGAWSLGQEFEG